MRSTTTGQIAMHAWGWRLTDRHAMLCRLGWVVGLAVTLLSACGLIFSGVLFTRLSLLVPRAQVRGFWGHGSFLHTCAVQDVQQL